MSREEPRHDDAAAHVGLEVLAARNMGQNTELPQFTQGMYDARELAMGRVQAEAPAGGGEGVVGFSLIAHDHAWGRATEFLRSALRYARFETTTWPPRRAWSCR